MTRTHLDAALLIAQFLAIPAILFLVATVGIWFLGGFRKVGGPAPACFGSRPGPQERAENDCFSCTWREACLPRHIVAIVKETGE